MKAQSNGNDLFPVFLKLNQLHLLIVGGGKVGLEKLTAVLRNSPATQVRLVGTTISEDIRHLAIERDNLKLVHRAFEPVDLEGIELVILAVDDTQISSMIRKLAKARNLLVNVADQPSLCDFYLGSIVQKGDLKIAISTNGKSPTIAIRIKEYLHDTIPDAIDDVLQSMNTIRAKLKGDFDNKVKTLNEVTKGWLEE